MNRSILAGAFALFATSAFAHDFTVGDLVIAHPMSFATAETARVGAGYFDVTNNGETADTLIAATADFPRVEVHKSFMDGDVARMMHMEDGVEIAPGETVSFAPGGFHIMLMGLQSPLVAGESFEATLTFENAGDVAIVFNIEERTDAAMDHSNH